MSYPALTLPMPVRIGYTIFIATMLDGPVSVQSVRDEDGREPLVDGVKILLIRPGEAAVITTDGKDWYTNRSPFVHVPGRSWASWWKKVCHYFRFMTRTYVYR